MTDNLENKTELGTAMHDLLKFAKENSNGYFRLVKIEKDYELSFGGRFISGRRFSECVANTIGYYQKDREFKKSKKND